MLSPCKDCKRRKVGCHNVNMCPAWREYVECVQAAKARRDEYRFEQEIRGEHLIRRGHKPVMR